MAYDTEKLKKQALEAAEKHDLVFIQDVISYLPCSVQTFYTHELEKYEPLKEILNKNIVSKKRELRKKWFVSDNATLQLALMKLLATNRERQKISQSYMDHTTKGDKITGFEITILDEEKS